MSFGMHARTTSEHSRSDFSDSEVTRLTRCASTMAARASVCFLTALIGSTILFEFFHPSGTRLAIAAFPCLVLCTFALVFAGLSGWCGLKVLFRRSVALFCFGLTGAILLMGLLSLVLVVGYMYWVEFTYFIIACKTTG